MKGSPRTHTITIHFSLLSTMVSYLFPPKGNPTVPTFNFCTKFMGIPGIIHDRTPNWHPVSGASRHIDDLRTERSFASQAK